MLRLSPFEQIVLAQRDRAIEDARAAWSVTDKVRAEHARTVAELAEVRAEHARTVAELAEVRAQRDRVEAHRDALVSARCAAPLFGTN